jgi:MFS family permease
VEKCLLDGHGAFRSGMLNISFPAIYHDPTDNHTQWSGNGAVSYFLPVLLDTIGVKEERTQLLYNAFLNVISFVMASIGSRFVDRIGRRPILLIGTSLFVVWWTIITILTAIYAKQDNDNLAGSRAAIAFIYVFGITFSFAYTPLQTLYPVECLSYSERAKGLGMYNLIVNIASFFNVSTNL